MTVTLDKTWRKDVMTSPLSLADLQTRNSWLVWAIKEMLLLGNNGVKAGPNAWTVVGTCDSTQYAMDGTDYLVDHTNLVSGTGNHSWFVLRNAALGAGSGLELCIAFYDDASYRDELTIAYSWSAGFTGGAINARPTATDEYQATDRLACLSTNAASYLVTRLFSSDGEVTRFFVSSGTGLRYTKFFLEKLKNPTAMVTENFVILASLSTLTRQFMSSSTNSFNDTGPYYLRVDGEGVRARVSYLCVSSYDAHARSLSAIVNPDGEELVSRARLWSDTVTRKGLIGEPFDMYSIPAMTFLTMVAGAGSAKDFFSYGDYMFGNERTIIYG